MENMLKELKEKKKSSKGDSSVLCFVYVCKASTFVSKQDMPSLHLLVPDVQNLLQDRLLDEEHLIKNKDGNPDVALITEFLVCAYRLNPRHFCTYILPLCLKGAVILKLSVSKAILRLAREGQVLPWQPTLESSFSSLTPSCRVLFQEFSQSENAAKEPDEKKKDKNQQNYGLECLVSLISAYYQSPGLALETINQNSTVHINEILFFFLSLCNCVANSSQPLIQRNGFRLMQRLIGNKFIENWSKNDMMNGFFEIGFG